jgi:hypothetical protein
MGTTKLILKRSFEESSVDYRGNYCTIVGCFSPALASRS